MAYTIKLKNFESVRRELNEEYTKLINQSQRISAFQAITELAYNTPVDSGRARSAWALNTSKELIDSQGGVFSANPTIRLGPVPTNVIETLYITNGTPYILDLNAGSSLQAPVRFIETTISKYFKIKGTVARST